MLSGTARVASSPWLVASLVFAPSCGKSSPGGRRVSPLFGLSVVTPSSPGGSGIASAGCGGGRFGIGGVPPNFGLVGINVGAFVDVDEANDNDDDEDDDDDNDDEKLMAL